MRIWNNALTDPSGTTTYTWNDTSPLSELATPNNKGPEAWGPCACKKRDSLLRQTQFAQLFRRRPALAVPAADLVVFIQHRRQVHHVAFARTFGERLAGDARRQTVVGTGHASGVVEQPLQV